jgi:hypothetical protein
LIIKLINLPNQIDTDSQLKEHYQYTVEKNVIMEEFYNPMIYDYYEMEKLFDDMSYHAGHIFLEYATVQGVNLRRPYEVIRELIKNRYGRNVTLHGDVRTTKFKEFLRTNKGFNDDSKMLFSAHILNAVITSDIMRKRLYNRLEEVTGYKKSVSAVRLVHDWLQQSDYKDTSYKKPAKADGSKKLHFYIYENEEHRRVLNDSEYSDEKAWC